MTTPTPPALPSSAGKCGLAAGDSRSYEESGQSVDLLLAEIAQNPGFSAVETDLKINPLSSRWRSTAT